MKDRRGGDGRREGARPPRAPPECPPRRRPCCPRRCEPSTTRSTAASGRAHLLVKYAVRYKGAGETVATRAWPLAGPRPAEVLEAEAARGGRGRLAAEAPAGLRYGDLPAFLGRIGSQGGREGDQGPPGRQARGRPCSTTRPPKTSSAPGESARGLRRPARRGRRRRGGRQGCGPRREEAAGAGPARAGGGRAQEEKWLAVGTAVLKNIGLLTGRKRTISGVETALSKNRMEDNAEARVEACRPSSRSSRPSFGALTEVDPARFEERDLVPSRTRREGAPLRRALGLLSEPSDAVKLHGEAARRKRVRARRPRHPALLARRGAHQPRHLGVARRQPRVADPHGRPGGRGPGAARARGARCASRKSRRRRGRRRLRPRAPASGPGRPRPRRRPLGPHPRRRGRPRWPSAGRWAFVLLAPAWRRSGRATACADALPERRFADEALGLKPRPARGLGAPEAREHAVRGPAGAGALGPPRRRALWARSGSSPCRRESSTLDAFIDRARRPPAGPRLGLPRDRARVEAT